MMKKVLVANRGEIAVRIIRACKEMGLKTVAVFSETDRNDLSVQFADESVCIGQDIAKNSYLDISNIISACQITNADAVHPGYGFLSENHYFAEVCAMHNINFIGPSADMILSMGNKIQARKIAKNTNVPIVPGLNINHTLMSTNELFDQVRKIGYPVIIKAALGGGGKGMRIVYDESDLLPMLKLSSQESKISFSSEDVYIEKYFTSARHIEIQIVADKHGHIYALPERDCSIQRKHQKLIEETPACNFSQELREKMQQVAISLVKHAKYFSVGTIEFLLDETNNFYFLEMNTRIQVEHPITEMISNLDLLKLQIMIAQNEIVDIPSSLFIPSSFSMECRINAEDVYHAFRPSPGTIKKLILPGGNRVRIDSHIYQGYIVPTCYDSLIMKIIVQDDNRKLCIAKMRNALNECKIEGIHSTIAFYQWILTNENFLSGNFDTNFLEKNPF